MLAFLRQHEGETILVVANLSRFAQPVEIDLSRFSGCAPMEVFSRNLFPPIKKAPYILTIGPHGHFWFAFQSQKEKRPTKKRIVPTLDAEPKLRGSAGEQSARADRARDFAGTICADLPLVWGEGAEHARDADHRADPGRRRGRPAQFWLVQVDYTDGAPDVYVAAGASSRPARAAEALARSTPQAVIARVGGKGVLYDALWDAGISRQNFPAHGERRAICKGRNGQLVGVGSSLLEAGA